MHIPKKMSEKLCLQWNDFQENIKTAFANLREDNDFADVTLACEDGQQVKAHKMVLAASSSFFQRLIGRNKHPHPLIYMRGVKFDDLLAILDFLYHGEANVPQENLEFFLSIAEELQLKGLTGKANVEDFGVDQKYEILNNKPVFHKTTKSAKKRCTTLTSNKANPEADSHQIVAVSNAFSGDLDGLEEKVKSMMVKGQNLLASGYGKAYVCNVCGKEGGNTAIKDHIEANHLEGIIVPCNLCDKSFRSRNALRKHKMRLHEID